MRENKFILDSNIFQRLQKISKKNLDIFLYVDIPSQSLYVLKNQLHFSHYSISTSKFGIGNKEGSYKTPQGIHRIVNKIGSDAPSGRIFEDRKDTGIDWHPGITDDNLILTRILRLEGLEQDINRGHDIDSYERYIYIHGTNREDLIGTPMSHGCVCMKSNDIIELFDIVLEGTIVIIN